MQSTKQQGIRVDFNKDKGMTSETDNSHNGNEESRPTANVE